ncbi:UvrD-helicase domain-containing protein [Pikeienuella piscinae]|uniref:DNA 3'-5' helicase n=1 Tax=Pikeienuella piscinae TaxID=2748098 RepID=A0A7L5BXR3_9RHOB|nr:UvrD-helicase domain-containing protein [Pikeienuella piscinae]QIE55317.1 UvrD-helicase domain-containing protein [Pikeienuella piscinae]
MNDPLFDDAFDDWEPPTRLSELARAGVPAPYLDGLNPPQREAVEALDGPVLMLAGAGTGKTRALTCRIAHLLSTGRAKPNEILAVTFTNKAAREMKVRIGGLIGGAIEGMPWLGTFHSLCVRILRRHAELAGLKSNFTILDTDDQIRLMKQLIRDANIDEKRWPARQLAAVIDRWKNRAVTPERIPAADARAYGGEGPALYARYQERLKVLNACDFGDLLLHVVRIFQENPDVLERYQRWFRYILVDEYQDTNVAQYLWLRLLAKAHQNICCVGDDDQSIYGWRGAEVGNILKFETDFPGAKVIRLEQNYRSTSHILAAASALIAANEDRLGKTLWTQENEGERLRLMGVWDGDEEARWIGEEIESFERGARGRDPVSPDEMAVLVRASFQMRAFEDRFLAIGLPYRVIGGPRFYERMEVRDAMAYLRVVASPDDGLAFERIVNTPKRGLGDKAQQEINRTARENGVNLLEGARIAIAEKRVSAAARNSLDKVVTLFDTWIERAGATDFDHVEGAMQILEDFGYLDHWRKEKTPDAPGRLENVKELVKALEEFENLQGFLEHVSLVMENEQEDSVPKVSIMTYHAAKGLEFDCVFLPGWEDGLFPSQRSMDESGKRGLEEERRLAYVGLTRARKHLTVSFAANRRMYNQWQSALPSRFIDELPRDHVEVLTAPGLYGGVYGAAASVPQGSVLEARAAEASAYNSPGWARMQARAGRRSLRSPTEARTAVVDAEVAHGPGDRVFHQKFGYGAVTEVEGDKLTVAFEKAGEKRVVASFVTAADEIPF